MPGAPNGPHRNAWSKGPTSFSALPRDGRGRRSAGRWAYRGRRSRSGSTGTRQVALKSCSRTDHARVDPARSLRTTKRRSSARPSRRSPQTPRTGVAVSWPRKWASIRPPSRGSGGLMDYSPTASSTSSCPLILTSLKSCATWWVSTSIPRSGPLSSLSTRRARSKPSTAPSQVFPSRRGALEP